MEIIHLVLGKANPDRMNGVNKVVYQLATEQAIAKKSVAVWGITNDLSHNYGTRKFETKLFKANKNPFLINDSLKAAIIEKKGKAIFHFHGGWIPIYATISKLMYKHNIEFVITPHGAYNTIAMQRSALFKKLYFQFFEKKMLERSHKIHSLGKSEMLGLQNIYSAALSKSFLLPYGFEKIVDSNIDYLKNETFVVGFVGRLDIYTKGLDILVNAFSKFVALKPNSLLWIVGDGKEKEQLASLILQKNIGDKVVFWGSKFGIEKNNLIKGMSVFAHPSRNEGLPVSVLEACNFGIPVIVSTATNLGDYISEYGAGITIPNESELLLENGLLNLYNLWEQSNFENLKINAKKMVSEAFNWEVLVHKFDSLYQH